MTHHHHSLPLQVKRHMSSHGIVGTQTEKTTIERQDEVTEAVTIAAAESIEAECPSGLTEVTSNSDGTSIDVHQLPVSDIYTVSILELQTFSW